MACGILVPQPGIEPGPLQWKRRVLTTGPPGNSLIISYNNQIFLILPFHSSFFNWSTVDLQCHVSFRCTAQWFIYIYISMNIYIWTYIYEYIYEHIFIYMNIYEYIYMNIYILFQILFPYKLFPVLYSKALLFVYFYV